MLRDAQATCNLGSWIAVGSWIHSWILDLGDLGSPSKMERDGEKSNMERILENSAQPQRMLPRTARRKAGKNNGSMDRHSQSSEACMRASCVCSPAADSQCQLLTMTPELLSSRGKCAPLLPAAAALRSNMLRAADSSS
jgi:hypothetical protein